MPMENVGLNLEAGLRRCRDELILLNLRNKHCLKKVMNHRMICANVENNTAKDR